MRFRPVSSSAQQGGGTATATLAPSSAQFSVPSLPSNGRSTYEDLIRGAGGGGASSSTNDNENGTGTMMATRSSTKSSSTVLSHSPPPSSTKKKMGSNANKRTMLRSPLSFLSPNERSVGGSAASSRTSLSLMGGSHGSVNSSSVIGTSARKLFTSPTTRRTRHRKKRMGASTKSQPQLQPLTTSSPAKSLSNSNNNDTSGASLSIYSPSPTKKGRTSGSNSNDNIMEEDGIDSPATTSTTRFSLSGSQVKGSLRKERKKPRHKNSITANTDTTTVPSIDANGDITGQIDGEGMQIDDLATSNEQGKQQQEETMMQEEGRTGDASNVGETMMEDVVTVDFAYPSQDDVAIPGPAVLEYFHGLATRESPNVNVEDGTATTEVSTNALVSTLTHQVQLDTLGTKLLSLEDVLIPSVVHEENAALKRIQAKLQRDPTGNAEAIQLTKEVRTFVMELGGNMAIAVKANRLEREERHSVAERRKIEEAQAARKEARLVRRTERARAKEERRAARAAEKERARIKRKKNWPRNKELWREVAMLMTDLARLQKEERAWDEAGKELDRREVELERILEERKVRRQREEEEEREKEGDAEEETEEDCDAVVKEGRTAAVQAETSVLNAIDDITLAASRINATLGSISDLMAKSDEVRKEVYGKYRAEHQFHGYRGSRDTKGLIVALSQDC